MYIYICTDDMVTWHASQDRRLKHVPSHWFRIQTQSQSPPRKTLFLPSIPSNFVPSISFLSDFKYGKWPNQDLRVEPTCYAPTITDWHGLRVGGVFGILNTSLHNPTLCQPSTWEGREGGSMTICRSHVRVHTDLLTKATKIVFLQQHWLWTLWGGLLSPLSLPNETQSPLPRKRKKKKSKTNKSEWSTSGDDQHTARDREVAFPWWQLRLTQMIQHTLFCKRHSHIVCL